MTRAIYFLPLLLAISLAGTLAAVELPVRQVVLYKHGVGYFERSGPLNPGETAQLDFKASEMDDVLKSLTIEQRGGGRISALRYDSSEPLEQKLAEFPFRLERGQPLSAVLDQLKGAVIELTFGSDTVRGTIVSGRVIPGDEKRVQNEQITLLTASGELRNFDLAAASGVRFVDATLQTQFQQYLAALVGARSREKRSVYIESTGASGGQVIADYMIPMPVWKSSYRLILADDADPMLEGWAIVDNTTGEDWNNVQLALVSGRPISFISRLYEPRYIIRPTAELPEDRAQAPVVLEGAIEEAGVGGFAGGATVQGTVRDRSGSAMPGATITIRNMGTGSSQTVTADGRGRFTAQSEPGTYEVTAAMPGFQREVRSGVMLNAGQRTNANFTLEVGGISQTVAVTAEYPASLARREMLSDAPQEGRMDAFSSVAATAAARELGELFEYRFDDPVTVRSKQSAMLPFLQQTVETKKLLVYVNQSSAHPLNAAEITNSTGKTLDGGPITVYESNAYAGEALMETLKAGDKRLIGYGIDLGTRITTQFESKGNLVREIHFRRGVLTAKTAVVETKTYTIRNVDQKAKTLIIQHPVRPQYNLLMDVKPVETTTNAYRFEVRLGPDSTEKFPITEERVFDQTFAITNLTPDLLSTYIQNKELSATARQQLEQVAGQKRQIAATDGEIRRAEAQVQRLFEDQERIRQNINSLNRVSGQQQQVQEYATRLAAQEVQLASLRDRLSELQQRKTTLEAELNALIERMEF